MVMKPLKIFKWMVNEKSVKGCQFRKDKRRWVWVKEVKEERDNKQKNVIV